MELTAAMGVNIQFYDGKNIRVGVAEAFGACAGLQYDVLVGKCLPVLSHV